MKQSILLFCLLNIFGNTNACKNTGSSLDGGRFRPFKEFKEHSILVACKGASCLAMKVKQGILDERGNPSRVTVKLPDRTLSELRLDGDVERLIVYEPNSSRHLSIDRFLMTDIEGIEDAMGDLYQKGPNYDLSSEMVRMNFNPEIFLCSI